MNWLTDPTLYQMIGICVVFWLMTQFLNGLGGTGLGYMAQRYYAAADERSASLMSAEWTVLLSIRWAMVAALVVLGLALASSDVGIANLLHDDPEKTLPVVLNYALPEGLKGLAIAGLIAAAMSTFDSTVNVGASYWVRDIYQRFMRPNASEKALVRQGWIASVVMCVVAVSMAFGVDSINEIWDWIVGPLGIAVTIPLALPWYWHRFNGWGYAIGSGGGLIAAVTLGIVDHNLAFYETFAIAASVSAVCSIAGALLTAKVDDGDLRRFYHRVRPWGFWRPVARNDGRKLGREAAVDLSNMFIGLVWQITMFLSAALFVLQQWDTFYLTFSATVVLTFVLYFTWYQKLPPFGVDETFGDGEDSAADTIASGRTADPSTTVVAKRPDPPADAG
jgi:Na+/proline symporter